MNAIETIERVRKETDLAKIRAIATEWLEKSEIAENAGEIAEAFGVVEEAIKCYATMSRTACYNEAVKSGNPMQYAILEFFYPTIKVKENKDNETKAITRTIEDAEKPIDLGDLHKRKGGIGADKHWIYAAEKFNYYLSIRAAERVNAEIKKDSFYMNEISQKISLGKNPCSNTQLLKTLQGIVDMMLGEGYKVTSHDVNYLIDVYANDNKKSKTGITAANHKTLRGYLKKVCYRILTNGKGYDVQQKEIKDK